MQRITGWLKQGWHDFRATMGISISFSALFALIGMATIWLLSLRGYGLIAYPFAMGFLVVAPVLLTGYQRVARLMREGRHPVPRDLLMGISDGTPGIWFLTFILFLCYLIWVTDALVIYAIYFDIHLVQVDSSPLLKSESLDSILTYLMYSGLMGLFIALASFAISIFSIPLIMHHKMSFVGAIYSSVRTVFLNFRLMMTWGLTISLMVIVGLLVPPLLVVILPVVAYASYAAFVDMYPDIKHAAGEL